jgi:membrane-associated protease RseP (regulator of RpoE activity)
MRNMERKSPLPAPGPRAKTAIALALAVPAILAGAFALTDWELGLEFPGARKEAAAAAFDHALGATIEPLDDATAESLGLSPRARGLVITSLAENGPAAPAGLRPGDVIERIGRVPVATPAEAASALRGARAAEIILTLNRRGHYAIVHLPIRPLADFAEQGDER